MSLPAVQLDSQPNEAGDVRVGRLVMAVMAAAFPVWWWVLQATYPWAKDPLAPRLLISLLAIGVAGASLVSEQRAREVPGWMALVCSLASMVAVWLAWTNAALPAYVGQLVATVGVSALAVRNLTHVRWYWTSVLVSALIAAAWSVFGLGESLAEDAPFVVVACAVMFVVHWNVAKQEGLLQDEITDRTTLLRAIFENATDALFLVDPVTNATELVNERAVDMFEARSTESLTGKSLSKLQTRTFTSAELNDIWRITDAGGEFRAEVQYHSLSGNAFWGEVVYRPLDIRNRRLLLVRIDKVDERVQAKQALEAARDAAQAATVARTDFLARMSHEIRTPLNGVLGLASLLEGTKLTEEQLSYIQTILTSGRNLRALIDEILDFSSGEAGELVLVDEMFDVNAAIDELQLLFRMQAVAKDLTLTFKTETGVPDKCLVDGRRIRQVLVNLIGNALKFTEKGSVTVTVRAATGLDRLGLRFEVVDTGIGIAPDVLPRLFEPFHQADPGISRRYGGTGLGLAISKAIAKRLGGSIRAVSQVGKGSSFTFDAPVRPAPIEVVPERQAAKEAIPTDKRHQVLMAEDNEVNVMVTAAMLRRLNCDVDIARNGAEAAERARQRPYEIIFMDVMMPDVDGLEATRRIRAMRPAKRPYIVALTAGVMPTDRERCVAAGMDDFVPKPVQLEEIRSAIDRADRAARLRSQP